MTRVYLVEDRVESIGIGYVRARSKREAVDKAKRGEVQFDYEPGNARLSAEWVRDPERARHCDPGETG